MQVPNGADSTLEPSSPVRTEFSLSDLSVSPCPDSLHANQDDTEAAGLQAAFKLVIEQFNRLVAEMERRQDSKYKDTLLGSLPTPTRKGGYGPFPLIPAQSFDHLDQLDQL